MAKAANELVERHSPVFCYDCVSVGFGWVSDLSIQISTVIDRSYDGDHREAGIDAATAALHHSNALQHHNSVE